MFELLFDDSEPEVAQARAEPHVEPVPPAPAAARRARGGVASHSEHSKSKIRFASAKRALEKANSKIDVLAANSFTSFSHHVASVSFGHRTADDRQMIMLSSGGSACNLHSKNARRTTDDRTCKHYGCVSAVYAQATGLIIRVTWPRAPELILGVSKLIPGVPGLVPGGPKIEINLARTLPDYPYDDS